ncbi:hypothetical protein ACWELQ_38995, partial [Nocardia sp. NPDC004722]
MVTAATVTSVADAVETQGISVAQRKGAVGRNPWRLLYPVAAFVLVIGVWELVKALVPANGVSVGGQRVLPRTTDAALPHSWAVLTVLGERDGKTTVGATLLRTASFTLELALLALVVGTVVGIRAQAVLRDGTLAHDFLLERTPRSVHVLNA